VAKIVKKAMHTTKKSLYRSSAEPVSPLHGYHRLRDEDSILDGTVLDGDGDLEMDPPNLGIKHERQGPEVDDAIVAARNTIGSGHRPTIEDEVSNQEEDEETSTSTSNSDDNASETSILDYEEDIEDTWGFPWEEFGTSHIVSIFLVYLTSISKSKNLLTRI
jgi:hypothetical protein